MIPSQKTSIPTHLARLAMGTAIIIVSTSALALLILVMVGFMTNFPMACLAFFGLGFAYLIGYGVMRNDR